MNLVASSFWEFSTSPSEDNSAAADPSRDEVTDPARGGHEGEPRDEEKTDTHQKQNESVQQHHSTTTDVSMFSTLTELLLNPFLDGYCKTPFCSDGDYLPPSCPSGGFYTTPGYSGGAFLDKSQEEGGCDEYGEICMSNSGASSAGVSSHGRRRRRQRPLALPVGFGEEWKDNEGRRVVITPSASRRPRYLSPHHTPSSPAGSPYRHRPAYHPTACTCAAPGSTNSLLLQQGGGTGNNINRSTDHSLSPHQTKAVMCKFCSSRLHDNLEVPPSQSSGTISSHGLVPSPVV